MSLEFHYQIPWRAQGGHPGHHAGVQSGGGFEFQGVVPFISHPDPRQLDLHAMIADPLQRMMVKSFRQRAAIPVYLLADFSASMGFQGNIKKTSLLAEFAAATAWSAWRTGDPFGFYACDAAIRWDLSLPLRLHKGLDEELRIRIAGLQPTARNPLGLLESASLLGKQKSLVFLASDYHWPDSQLEDIFNALVRHDVVPVVLWDSGEYENLPQLGLAEVLDPETGQSRQLFLRPSLRNLIKEHFLRRRKALIEFCTRHGREPFFIIDRFEPDAMTNYFYQS